jgi:hypothetical protein
MSNTPSSPPEGNTSPAPPTDATVSLAAHKSVTPRLEQGSGQRPSETWQEYFKRLGDRNRERVKSESPVKKQQRLAREQAHARQGCPGHKGPVVWHWEEDEETGFRIRRRVPRGRVDGFWGHYTTTQRRFNSFANEWDVCTEFDSDAEVDDWDEDDYDVHQQASSPIVPVQPAGLSSSPSQSVITLAIARLTQLSAVAPASAPTLHSTASADASVDPPISMPSVLPHVVVPHVSPIQCIDTQPTPPSSLSSANPCCMDMDIDVQSDLAAVSAPAPAGVPAVHAAADAFIASDTAATMPPAVPPVSSQCTDTQFSPTSSQSGAAQGLNAAVQTEPLQWEDTLAHTYGHAIEPSKLEVPSQLEDLLFERYGFLGPDSGYDVARVPGTCWADVRKIFGDVKTHVDARLQVPITHFLDAVLCGDMGVLNQLWDLAPNSSSPLPTHANSELRVATLSSAQVDLHFVRAARENCNDAEWDLVLEDPATVLECCRRGDGSVRAIARFLVNSGRAFSTFIPRYKIPPLEQGPATVKPIILGRRPMGYQPLLTDYAYYEQLRTTFMACPHARAAFLAGGIIWRLAMDSARSLAEERALDGPSEESLQFGKSLLRSDNVCVWDDTLTEAEMDLICGVYNVDTGKLWDDSYVEFF